MPRKNFLYFQFRISDFKSGFTLIEFLVVLGILSVVVTSTMLFLTSILKGANQANVTADVKQNGQFVLDSLERQIRNSFNAAEIGAGSINIVLTRSNEVPLYLKCFPAVGTTANGYIGSFASNTAPTSDSDYSPISNSSLVAGVNITGCTLDVVVGSASSNSKLPPVVIVKFTAEESVGAPGRVDFEAKAPFQTTISLREY